VLSDTKAAFEAWQAGRLEDAAALYREALADLGPGDWRREPIHGELAAVLQTLGDHAGASDHLQAALSAALRDGDDTDVVVVVARYFLADSLRRQGRSEEALATIAPSLAAGGPKSWLLHVVEAESLLALGREHDAATAAERALALAPSDDKRADLSARLAAARRTSGAP
jgi:tetratricopeptide (TPR) repeat protein